jgi:hypothetical protein
MKMIPLVRFFFAGAHDWQAQPIFDAKKIFTSVITSSLRAFTTALRKWFCHRVALGRPKPKIKQTQIEPEKTPRNPIRHRRQIAVCHEP